MAGTYTYTFNTVLAAHLREIVQREPREQAYEKNALLSQLERTNDIMVDRGGYIHVNVSAVEEWKGGPYDGAKPVNTAGSEDVHTAQYRRALYAEPIQILHSEELDAGGERKIFDLATHKMKQTKLRLQNMIAAGLWNTTIYADQLIGLPSHIPTDPTTGVLGGIDRALYPWWQSKAVTTFGPLSANLPKLDKLILDASAGGADYWDWMCVDKDTFVRFMDAARTYLSINTDAPRSNGGKRIAELGFPLVEYQGKPVFWDRNSPADRGYGVNNLAIKLGIITGEEWSITDFQPMHGTGVQGRIAFMRWGGQTLSIEPRLNFVYDGVQD
jgi:hypothetical protein